MEASTATTATADTRQKVDHDLALKLRTEGKSARDIAEQGLASGGTPVALGTIYKILREKGAGSGRTLNRQPKGVNVSAELTATIERLQGVVNKMDEDTAAEKERHTAALATIESEGAKAKSLLETLTGLVPEYTDPEPVSENGSDPSATTEGQQVEEKSASAKASAKK